jgi:hypothetical protein
MQQILADVKEYVPAPLMADLSRVVRQRQDAKDTDLMIFVPLDDYGRMMLDIMNQMGKSPMAGMPFTPVLMFGDPIAVVPHDKTFVAVKSRPNGTAKEAVFFAADGKQHEVT